MQKTIIKLKKADINGSIRSHFKLERENKAIKDKKLEDNTALYQANKDNYKPLKKQMESLTITISNKYLLQISIIFVHIEKI